MATVSHEGTFMQRVAERQRQRGTSPSTATPLDDIIVVNGQDNQAAYVQTAIENETAKLAAMSPKSGRNHQLNRAAFNLRRFIDNGSIDEDTIFNALYAAAEACGLVNEDGSKQCENSIRSGFKGSTLKVGAKPIPQLSVSVVEVDATAFTETNSHVATIARPAGLSDVLSCEADFWDRESLNTIYRAALGRMCSPWAVLGHCAARALTLVRPGVRLPPLIGGPGSLNWFTAIAAPSGGGKGSASAVARELIDHPIRERGLGSGEGITGQYHKPGTKDSPPEIHEAVMFVADEIDTMTALGSRTGSTTMSILRSGFAGETLGFSYITKGRDVHIDAHTYRMTVVISVQPARAGGLMGDHGGGTPQRFMWFPGNDPRITDTPNDTDLYPLALPEPGEWQYPRTLTIPDEARQLILTERAKAARGEQAALDGHAVFCREKFAFSLAVLDGRTQMTSEDWRLSGIAAQISSATRDWVAAELAVASETEATDRGRLLGVSQSASDEERAYRTDQRARRMARWAMDKLTVGPMTNRELMQACASRDRTWLGGALQGLTNAGLVGRDDEKRWMKL